MLGACPFLSVPYTLRKAIDKPGKRSVEGEVEKLMCHEACKMEQLQRVPWGLERQPSTRAGCGPCNRASAEPRALSSPRSCLLTSSEQGNLSGPARVSTAQHLMLHLHCQSRKALQPLITSLLQMMKVEKQVVMSDTATRGCECPEGSVPVVVFRGLGKEAWCGLFLRGSQGSPTSLYMAAALYKYHICKTC